MKESEKILKELMKHLDSLEIESEDELNEETQKFIDKLNKKEINFEDTPEYESDELLEEAYEAETEKEARSLAKKALEVYPDNIDAQVFLANMERNPVNRLKQLDWAIEKARKILEEEGLFEEDNIGHFWGMIETRPYMRARNSKLQELMILGRYKEAVKESEELLKLCENDNMGVRSLLMGLYCYFEEFDKCEKLHEQYKEDRTISMLFPMAIMYYKKGDYRKAEKMLNEIDEKNPFIVDYCIGEVENEIDEDPEYYSLGSQEEAYITFKENFYLIASLPSFINFVAEKLYI